MVVACLALTVALGGTGYAAISIPRNSVGTTQLKKNAVVSSKVKNRSLKAVDFASGQLPRGAKGAKGDMGNTGAAGAAGATNVVVVSKVAGTVTGSAGDYRASADVVCPSGSVATGGGVWGWNVLSREPWIEDSYPLFDANTSVPYGWHGGVKNDDPVGGGGGWGGIVYVICASP